MAFIFEHQKGVLYAGFYGTSPCFNPSISDRHKQLQRSALSTSVPCSGHRAVALLCHSNMWSHSAFNSGPTKKSILFSFLLKQQPWPSSMHAHVSLINTRDQCIIQCDPGAAERHRRRDTPRRHHMSVAEVPRVWGKLRLVSHPSRVSREQHPHPNRKPTCAQLMSSQRFQSVRDSSGGSWFIVETLCPLLLQDEESRTQVWSSAALVRPSGCPVVSWCNWPLIFALLSSDDLGVICWGESNTFPAFV